VKRKKKIIPSYRLFQSSNMVPWSPTPAYNNLHQFYEFPSQLLFLSRNKNQSLILFIAAGHYFMYSYLIVDNSQFKFLISSVGTVNTKAKDVSLSITKPKTKYSIITNHQPVIQRQRCLKYFHEKVRQNILETILHLQESRVHHFHYVASSLLCFLTLSWVGKFGYDKKRKIPNDRNVQLATSIETMIY